MVPVARLGSKPRLSRVGKLSRPSVTTVAPTMPVLAAISPPTNTTATSMPPCKRPSALAIDSSKSSAMRARSSTTPISTNSGTAMSVSLFITPNNRLGRSSSSGTPNAPTPRPSRPNSSATPAKVKATG